MAITVNIVGNATATINESDNITISTTIQILNGATIINEKVISISVFLHTKNVYNYALQQMVQEIEIFKALSIKQKNINNLTANFTTDLQALL